MGSKRKITFYYENPPRGKFARKLNVVIEEKVTELSPKDAAEFLGITPSGVYALLRKKKLPFRKPGGRCFIKVIDLDKYKVLTGRREPFEGGKVKSKKGAMWGKDESGAPWVTA